jgi:hypothetical protein
MSCCVFERIETFYMHLSRVVTAERSTRASTCMPVASRIAGSPDLVSRIPTIVTVALESCPILDGIGSAFVARWNPTGQLRIMAVGIPRYSRDSIIVLV